MNRRFEVPIHGLALVLTLAIMLTPPIVVAEPLSTSSQTNADNGGGKTNTGDATKANEKTCKKVDCRPDFPVNIFIGSAIDSFAAGDLQKYLNPDASGEVNTFERLIGGIDFAYRLSGDPTKKEKQFWVYGWTVHGVRSADVDCQKNPKLTVCQDQLGLPDVNDFVDQYLYTLRNASSLEAAIGLRWEFARLKKLVDDVDQGGTAASLYLAAQAGFLTVTGDDDDVIADHAVALGAIATNSVFEGSYLQVGYGRTDLFESNTKDRWKVDALLIRKIAPATNFFAKITVDVDAIVAAVPIASRATSASLSV